VATYLYLGFVVAVWILFWAGVDRWWPPTILAYGPRWVYLLPLLVLVPFVMIWCRWPLLIPLAVSALVGFFPIMGFCVPLGFSDTDAVTLRVLTCNTGGKQVDVALLHRLIDRIKPDIILLQECGKDSAKLVPEGWNAAITNAMLVASPHAMRDQKTATSSYPPSKWPRTNALCVSVETPSGPTNVCSVHLRTARWGILPVLDRHTVVNPSRKYILKREIENRRLESEELAQWIKQFSGPMIIAGDFNMPPDSVVYRQYWDDYANAFSKAGFGFGTTRWTKMKGITFGIRIDHILSDEHWHPVRCWLGPDIGSDHLPVLADLRIRN